MPRRPRRQGATVPGLNISAGRRQVEDADLAAWKIDPRFAPVRRNRQADRGVGRCEVQNERCEAGRPSLAHLPVRHNAYSASPWAENATGLERMKEPLRAAPGALSGIDPTRTVLVPAAGASSVPPGEKASALTSPV
jgi:hypothetical protein